MDLSRFVLHTSLSAAKAVIGQEGRVRLTKRDSLRALETVERPPAPTGWMTATLQNVAPHAHCPVHSPRDNAIPRELDAR
jgi:uncharacterized protein (DUF1778 family)